ncbi:HlyD family secretion protein [Lichenicoccus sp.]|uniref:HlyD family secretion protein n=1 Tax=Lichenicoccus sp. TaxID=2781899 RepID=UPI003D098C60
MNDMPDPSNVPGADERQSRTVEPPAVQKRGNRPLIVLAVIVLVLAGMAAWYYATTRDMESTDDAQVDGNTVTIEAKVSGYLTQLYVNDNQQVGAGQLLFRIDARDYRATRDQDQAALAQAQAQAASAGANLGMARITAPAKLAAARAQSASAAATLALAAADLKRQNSVERRSTSQQSIDQAAQTFRSDKANFENEEAQVAIANVVAQTIAQAQAQYDQAVAEVAQQKAQLAAADLNLGYTQVRAPQDGWVTQRNAQRGSYVAAGQSTLSLVAPDVWVTANFKENQLARMRVGQRVKIRVDAYPKLRLEGHVDSLQLGTGSRFSAFPAENATGNFIKIVQRVPVKIVIDSGLNPDMPLPLGLSVVPTVALR